MEDAIETKAEGAAETAAEATAATETAGAADAPVAAETAATEGAGTAAEKSAETAEPAKARPASLLDDEPEETAAAEQPKEGAPTEEEMKAFREGISAFDLGDGVRWDDDAFRAYQPALMALTGGDPKKAEPVVKAHVAYLRAQQKRADEAADAFNAGLIQECKNRFGDDLKKVANFAKQGGKAVFGERIWNEMKTIPAFANNPDIMEKLAEVGRRYATDGGKVIANDGDGARDRGDVLHRMYGNVKL